MVEAAGHDGDRDAQVEHLWREVTEGRAIGTAAGQAPAGNASGSGAASPVTIPGRDIEPAFQQLPTVVAIPVTDRFVTAATKAASSRSASPLVP